MSLTVFRREVTIATRRGRLQTGRAWFAGILLVIVLGTFAAWYFAADGRMSREMMSQVAERSYLFVGMAYATLLLGLATVAAVSIAGEMDRKTLGFVLTTRLRSAEIVMGKLAAILAGFAMDLGIGLPIMILLSVLGGVPPQLVLIAYAGISSTAVIVVAIGIFVSAGAANGRRALNVTLFSIMAWLILPVFVGQTPIFSYIGLRPPQFLMDINAWLLASNPITLLPMFLIGGVRPAALYHNVGWMCGLQLASAPILILGAIARLRPAYRANVGGDGGAITRRLRRPAWRFRPRPPVADDPILWREMYTNRGGLIGQVIGQCFGLAVLAALAYGTFFFGRRAFVELWHHGYTAVASTAEKPEMNLVLRYYIDESGSNVPIDARRVDFNLFLRFTTLSIVFMISLISAGIAVELISTEKAKDTWNSLIATSLSAREILLGKFRAALWRLRAAGIDHFRALEPGPSFRSDSSAGLPGGRADLRQLDRLLRLVRPDGGHPSGGALLGERRRGHAHSADSIRDTAVSSSSRAQFRLVGHGLDAVRHVAIDGVVSRAARHVRAAGLPGATMDQARDGGQPAHGCVNLPDRDHRAGTGRLVDLEP